MTERPLLQALRRTVVFFVGNVLVRLFQKLLRAVQAAGVIQARVYWRVIVQVFAVINRSLLDFSDCGVDLLDRFLLFMTQFPSVMGLEMRTGVPKIRQGMQISRMLSLRDDRTGAQGK